MRVREFLREREAVFWVFSQKEFDFLSEWE
jgi:hypothetical protein